MGQLLLEGSGSMYSHHKTSGTQLLLSGCSDQLNEGCVCVFFLMPSMLIPCALQGGLNEYPLQRPLVNCKMLCRCQV